MIENPQEIGIYSSTDIFDIYECLRNDKEQRRFIDVLDFVRQTFINRIGSTTSTDEEHPFPSASSYLSTISFLLYERIQKNQVEGLPELLKLFHVAIQATGKLDSDVAGKLIGLLSFFKSDNPELLANLCPAACDLTFHTAFNEAMIDQLVVGLCNGVLSDNSNLRNNAAKAIYNTPSIIPIAYNHLIQRLDENHLRALTVISNIIRYISPADWTANAQIFIKLCESSNRAVRAKALNLLAHGLHYFNTDSILEIVTKFTETVPSAPGDVLYALAELIQSSITILAHSDPIVLAANYPIFVKKLLEFFSLEDKEAENLIYSVFLYGIHAILSGEIDPISKGVSIQATIEQITSSLGAISVNIWPQLYQILSTLPEKIYEMTKNLTPDMLVEIYRRIHPESVPPNPPEDNDQKPLYLLEGPINATLSKLQDENVANHEGMITFLVAVTDVVGLAPFFNSFLSPSEEGDPLTNQVIFDTIFIPILSSYRSTKHLSDLEWTVGRFFQSGYEMSLFEAAIEDEPRRLWLNFWNAIIYAVTTPIKTDLNLVMINDGEEKTFPQFIETRLTFPSLKESLLVRPIARIIAKLPSQFLNTPIDFFDILLTISVQQNCSDVIIPTFEALARNMLQTNVDGKFTSLMANNILTLGQNPETIQQACSMVDIALCLTPYLSNEVRGQFYQILLSFITKPNQFQKKGFRAIRQFLNSYSNMETIGIDLEELKRTLELTASSENKSSSAIRYRLNLMVTILEHAGEFYNEMLSSFLPEFVAALKEPGNKTRAAAIEGIQAISASAIANGTINILIPALIIGLSADTPGMVSATIEAIDLIINRYFDKIDPELINQICNVIWPSVEANGKSSEVLRSASEFAKTLIKKLKRFVQEVQLPSLCQLGVICSKSSNWDIQKKGRNLIGRIAETFDEESVLGIFREQGEDKLLRSIKKERRRETREKGDEKRVETIGMEEGFSFDPNDGDIDLQNPDLAVSRSKAGINDEKEEEYQTDESERLILREASREEKKKKVQKVVFDDDDEIGGNEVNLQIRSRRQKAEEKRKRDTGLFVAGGLPSNDRKGKNKNKSSDFTIAPLSSKTVNKRYRGQMKATYKKLFKTGH